MSLSKWLFRVEPTRDNEILQIGENLAQGKEINYRQS